VLRPWIERATAKLGADHGATLEARCLEARWTRVGGDPWTACELARRLVPELVQVRGPYDQLTLAVRGTLAVWIGDLGDTDLAGARDRYAALVPDAERLFGADDPEPYRMGREVAALTGMAGDTAGARDQAAAMLPEVERARPGQ
jgi:hypothetical protein